MADIMDLIRPGKENAITRQELTRITGMTDREVRKVIGHAREKYPIINDGDGYYMPTGEEIAEAKGYIMRESARVRALMTNIGVVRKFIKTAEAENGNG